MKNANRQKKEAIVGELSQKIKDAKALIFTNYQGMTHQQIETLKKALKKTEAELVVTKNTLLKRALEGNQKDQPRDSDFEGPTATLFAFGDPITPLKTLFKTIKTLNLPIVKMGFVENQVFSAEEIARLASLPAREVLLAQVIGGLKAPLFGLHRALSWNMQKLVMTLKAIEKTKGDKN